MLFIFVMAKIIYQRHYSSLMILQNYPDLVIKKNILLMLNSCAAYFVEKG